MGSASGARAPPASWSGLRLKTLPRYLLRQVVATLLMTVLVFTFVLIVGNILKEVLVLLVNGQASLGVILKSIALLVPYAVAYALPMGMLTAVLLVFGRFSADLELTASRASGISLVSLTAPILLLSLVLCGLSGWANLKLAPEARRAFKKIVFTFTTEFSVAQIPSGQHLQDVPGYLIYIGHNQNGHLKDVLVYDLGQGADQQPKSLFAARGTIQKETRGTNHLVVLNLTDVRGLTFEGDQASPGAAREMRLEYDLDKFGRNWERRPGMYASFAELRAELRQVRAQGPPVASETNPEIRKSLAGSEMSLLVEMNRQWAFSFAPFGFALIGIPLGIRVQRRETNIGFAIAVALVLVYYGLILAALSLQNRPELQPHLLVWLPNLLFQTVGTILLWRANHGL